MAGNDTLWTVSRICLFEVCAEGFPRPGFLTNGTIFLNGDSFVLERALQTAGCTTSPSFCIRRGEDKLDEPVSSKVGVLVFSLIFPSMLKSFNSVQPDSRSITALFRQCLAEPVHIIICVFMIPCPRDYEAYTEFDWCKSYFLFLFKKITVLDFKLGRF